MNKKALIFFFLCCFYANNTFSQETSPGGITDGLSKFISWISNIDKVLSGIENRENLYALDRNLGYASLYIDQIANGKLLLAKEIGDLKIDKEDERHVESLSRRADEIVASINNLEGYLRDIKALLSQTDQKEVDSMIVQIDQGFVSRKMYLIKDIKNAIYEKNIPYDRILNEAKESKMIADNALKQIKVAKEKIITVLTK
jgi:hypothetical protein